MPHLFVRHKVKDYAVWKKAFDSFAGTRRAGGEKSFQIYRPDGDPNNLFLLFEWESSDKAKSFAASPDLKSAMQRAGVIEPPEVYVLEGAAQGKP